MSLPELNPDERELLEQMRDLLRGRIDAAAGRLPFDRFMEAALYAPGLGYYVNGRRKFGRGGDFVTAPDISPLFARCMARQVARCLDRLGDGMVLEFGAGSGRMAADLLAELESLGRLPARYLILDLSPSLRALQAETLKSSVPRLMGRVEWIDRLPEVGFEGVILGNEVLDAMPVHRFRIADHGWEELFVVARGEGFGGAWEGVASPGLGDALDRLWPDPGDRVIGYESEINLRLGPWVDALADCLGRGYLVLVDYGYSAREYYHPVRDRGTLICHFRHRAHDDPFALPGLQDITANVDFTALARSGQGAGFDVAGYTTQAHFLIDNGLDDVLASSDRTDTGAYLALLQGAKQLILPGEMGERFKVMSLSRDAPADPVVPTTRDLRDRL